MPYLSYPGIFLSKPEKIVKRRKKNNYISC
jgi:hypothetical protein